MTDAFDDLMTGATDVEVAREDGRVVARDSETGAVGYGSTRVEALRALADALDALDSDSGEEGSA